jgi:hypothetical protein
LTRREVLVERLGRIEPLDALKSRVPRVPKFWKDLDWCETPCFIESPGFRVFRAGARGSDSLDLKELYAMFPKPIF